MRYVIEVTAEDIRRAGELVLARDSGDHVPPLGQRCPIALGAMRALRAEVVETICDDNSCPTFWSLVVVYPLGGTRMFPLPDAAERFIYSFDAGASVEPFSFVVENGV